MDIVKVKDSSLVYSYKGGWKTSECSDLIAIECEKPFIRLIFENEKFFVRASLKTIETQLESHFIRISRQVIVNIHHVSELQFENGSYWMYLKNGAKYKVCGRRVKAAKAAFLTWTH